MPKKNLTKKTTLVRFECPNHVWESFKARLKEIDARYPITGKKVFPTEALQLLMHHFAQGRPINIQMDLFEGLPGVDSLVTNKNTGTTDENPSETI